MFLTNQNDENVLLCAVAPPLKFEIQKMLDSEKPFPRVLVGVMKI